MRQIYRQCELRRGDPEDFLDTSSIGDKFREGLDIFVQLPFRLTQ